MLLETEELAKVHGNIIKNLHTKLDRIHSWVEKHKTPIDPGALLRYMSELDYKIPTILPPAGEVDVP